MRHDKLKHSGFHRIGDRYATFFNPGRFLGRSPFDESWMAPHDMAIKNGNEQYEIEIGLPGFEKEEIQIELRQDTLTITANMRRMIDEYKAFVDGPVAFERKRSFQLGPEIDKENIKAQFEAGLLKIKLPFLTDGKTKVEKKKITIS